MGSSKATRARILLTRVDHPIVRGDLDIILGAFGRVLAKGTYAVHSAYSKLPHEPKCSLLQLA